MLLPFFFLYENFDVFAYVYTAKTDWLFNRRVVTLVAEKLKKQWLWEVYFGIIDYLYKTTYKPAGPDHLIDNPGECLLAYAC